MTRKLCCFSVLAVGLAVCMSAASLATSPTLGMKPVDNAVAVRILGGVYCTPQWCVQSNNGCGGINSLCPDFSCPVMTIWTSNGCMNPQGGNVSVTNCTQCGQSCGSCDIFTRCNNG
jgi:hypothetical protein